MKFLLSLALVLVFVLVGFGQSKKPVEKENPSPTQQNQSAFRLSADKNSVRVPFDLYDNNILIQVRINDSPPVWFIFDSGAVVNVINQNVVQSLGLKTKGNVSLNAGGGAIEGSVIENATIGLPGIEAFNQTIAAVPLDALSAYSGREIQGIIGNNFIKNFVVEIDYADQIIVFRDPKTYSLSGERNTIKLENHGGNPFIEVELSLDGKETMTGLFEIDTGSNGIFSVNRPFAEKHRLLEKLPKTSMAEGIGGAGLGGDTKNIDARVGSIRLGSYTLDKPIISISQDTTGFGASDEAGFIGTDLLRRFTVILDYGSRRMLLKPNARFKEPFTVDLSGLELITEANNFKVIKIKRVRANFPAAEAGLREGDVIVSVNGRPAADLGLSRLTKMFKDEGRNYLLTVKRNEKAVSIKLKLKKTI